MPPGEAEETLFQTLNTELTRFLPGSRFHSIRTIMRRYKTNLRIVNRVLSRMEANGTLERRPNIGFFVRQKIGRLNICHFFVDWPGDGVHKVSVCLKRELQKQPDRFHFSALPYHHESDLISLWESCSADAIIFEPPGRWFTPDEIAWLAASERPIIITERNLVDAGVHCTSGSPELGAMMVLQHLKKRKHRRLAVLSPEPLAGEVGPRLDFFLRWTKWEGLPVRVIPCRHAENGEYTTTLAYEALSADLAENGCDYTALFVVSDNPCKGALLALHEAGLRVPEDVSIVGYGFSPEPRFFMPPVTTVACRPDERAASLADALTRYFDGDHRKIAIRDVPVVIERDSVGPAPV